MYFGNTYPKTLAITQRIFLLQIRTKKGFQCITLNIIFILPLGLRLYI